MVLQKADSEALADLYRNDGIGYGQLFIVFNGGAVMKEKVFWFLAGIVISCVLTLIFAYPIVFDRGYNFGVRDSYYEKNGLNSPETYKIAGVGDDGFRKVYEGE